MIEAARAAADTDSSSAPRPTIAEIFRQYGPAYRVRYAGRISRQQLRVLQLLTCCRSGELGTAVYQCGSCGRAHYVPRSCGNRHCPQCQGAKARRWLERQQEQLLPCPYFLLTFTVPEEVRPLMRVQPRIGYSALFDAAAETLRELAANPKYVGSNRLGFTGVLHTWGRTLCFHPHVHFIVPGGALSADGQQWLSSRADFLITVKAASLVFRAKFRQRLEEQGLLAEVPDAAWRKNWVVHCQPVGDGRRALRYLAPYVYRVAISNRRILNCEPGPDGLGRVTLTYRKRGSRRERKLTVTADEFIRRFLQHVLPTGFQKVRHYGFAHPRQRIEREWLKMLVTLTLHLVYVLLVAVTPLPAKHVPRCAHCGGELTCVGFLPPPDQPLPPFDTS